LHIEIQSQTDADFPHRMFVYYYRIHDRYKKPVISLAILGDDQPNWRPSEYRDEHGGCEIIFRFPIAKLLDYQWETLEASDNPFAAIVMAHRKTQETTGDAQGRLRQKSTLIKRLFLILTERGYSQQAILELFRLLDLMMNLPEALELEFRDELRQFEEENRMEYVSSIERIGRQEERQDIVRGLLTSRFGVIDEDLEEVTDALNGIPSSEFGGVLVTLSTLSRDEILAQFRPNTRH
jgi:hypothetical protein